MSSTSRVYDYRIREQVVRTGNPDLFPHLEIPRATAQPRQRRGMPEVVWLDVADEENVQLRERVARLERRISMLTALLRLVLTVLRVSGVELGRITSRYIAIRIPLYHNCVLRRRVAMTTHL